MSQWPVHEYPVRILERHLDTFGHVNNARYLEIFEEARWDIVTDGGFGLVEIQKTGIGPVVLETHLRFLRELKLRDEVVVRTTVEDASGKVFAIRQKITGPGDVVYCDAVFKIGLFDTRERKLIPPTEKWLKAIGGGPRA